MPCAPRAAAPRISAASAIRLRSRTVICRIGAAPASATNAVAATADMRTAAPAPSVMLIASANVASSAACRRQASASAPRGGTSSVVTVNPSNVSRRMRGSLEARARELRTGAARHRFAWSSVAHRRWTEHARTSARCSRPRTAPDECARARPAGRARAAWSAARSSRDAPDAARRCSSGARTHISVCACQPAAGRPVPRRACVDLTVRGAGRSGEHSARSCACYSASHAVDGWTMPRPPPAVPSERAGRRRYRRHPRDAAVRVATAAHVSTSARLRRAARASPRAQRSTRAMLASRSCVHAASSYDR